MIMRSLQPRFVRHLIGFPYMDFGYLVQALYGIEEDIATGLWPESSLSNSKGKRPTNIQRLADISAISAIRSRPPRHYQTVGHTSGVYYLLSPHVQYRPPTPFRPMTPTYLHPTPQSVYATQSTQKPPTLYPQPRALPAQTQISQFSQLGMPLSQAFQKLVERGLLTALALRPPPQPVPPQFKMDFHCAYHQGLGHDIDHCFTLRHAIQDLIDQSLVKLG